MSDRTLDGLLDDAHHLMTSLDAHAHTLTDDAQAIHDHLVTLRDADEIDTELVEHIVTELHRVHDALDQQGHTLADDTHTLAMEVADHFCISPYPSWEWGEPCPECGADRFALTKTTTDIVTPTDTGSIQYGECLDADKQKLACTECWLELSTGTLPN